MSDATHPLDDEAMLNRLAACDLAAAERVHGRLMAAEDAAEIADLGRTYQRLARSLRQTLALKAKLAREREAAQAQIAARAQTAARPQPRQDLHPDSAEAQLRRLPPEVRAHADRVHAAVMRYIEREDEPPEYEGLYEDELFDILADMALDDGFLGAPVADLAAQVLDIMGLPGDAARPPAAGPEPEPEPPPAPDGPAIHSSA